MSNHLGNVLAVVSDRKTPVDTNNNGTANYWNATTITANDYYPFGLNMNNRSYSLNNESSRFGFNGKELDQNGEFGSFSVLDYGFRIYNPALGKFLSVDPLSQNFPWYTPYQFAGNSPIANIDLDGLEQKYYKLTFDEKLGETCLEQVDESDWAFLPDIHKVEIPELGINYTFSAFGGGGNIYNAGSGSGNSIYSFDKFADDPAAAMLSGKFKTDEEILSSTVKELLFAYFFGRLVKQVPRHQRGGIGSHNGTVKGFSNNIVKGVNPTKGCENCSDAALAVDRRLKGDATAVAKSDELTNKYGVDSKYKAMFGSPEVITTNGKFGKDVVQNLKPGQTGIVTVSGSGGRDGHAFNIINNKGKVMILDGQTEQIISTDQFKGYLSKFDKVSAVRYYNTTNTEYTTGSN